MKIHFMSCPEAAEVLGISAVWVRVLANRGEIKASRTRLEWLLDPEDVARLAAKRAAQGLLARERLRGGRMNVNPRDEQILPLAE